MWVGGWCDRKLRSKAHESTPLKRSAALCARFAFHLARNRHRCTFGSSFSILSHREAPVGPRQRHRHLVLVVLEAVRLRVVRGHVLRDRRPPANEGWLKVKMLWWLNKVRVYNISTPLLFGG